MDARENENRELLSELPLNVVHPELKSLPNDLLPEITEEIMRRAPAKITLFALTSSYWRSYHYLQQLRMAVVANYHEEEERILTNLLMNYALLMKESAKSCLSQWVTFLKKEYAYSFEKEVFTPARKQAQYKNIVYAQGLLIILEADRSEERMLQLDFLLTRVSDCPLQFLIIMPRLADSLKRLIAQAQGKASKPTLLNIVGIINSCNEVVTIRSVCEAQLILAPYVGALHQRSVELIGAVMSTMHEKHELHSIFLLHALIKMLPERNEFWLQYQDTFPALTARLPLPPQFVDQPVGGDFFSQLYKHRRLQSARIDLLVTLVKRLPTGMNPWSVKLLESLDSMTQQELSFFDELRKVTAICSLTDDESRVNWLERLFCSTGYDDALFIFAKRECAKLTCGVAMKTVIGFLEPLKLFTTDVGVAAKLTSLIDSLKVMLSLQPTHALPTSPAATLKR